MVGLDDYTYRHLAVHLHDAGRRKQLHRLLVGDRTWIETKMARFASTEACAQDLELAIGDFTDPMEPAEVPRLAELCVALQWVTRRVGLYSDLDLKTLVLLGRRQEALGHARMRRSAEERAAGMLAIDEADQRLASHSTELIEEWIAAAREIPQPEDRGLALGHVTDLLAKRGSFAEARSLAETIDHPGWRAITWRSVAGRLLERGHREQARQLASRLPGLSEVREPLQRVGVRSAELLLRSHLGSVAEASDDVRRCLEDIHGLGEAAEQIPGWLLLLDTLIRAGETRLAERVHRQMQQAIERIPQPWQSWISLQVAGKLAEWGEWAKAEAAIEKIETPPWRCVARVGMALSLDAAGRRASAESVLDREVQRLAELPSEDDRNFVLSRLAPALVKIGRHRQGLELAAEIGTWRGRAAALMHMALIFAEKERLDQASELFAEARDVLASVDGKLGRSTALGEMAVVLCHASRRDLSMRLLDIAETLLTRSPAREQPQRVADTLALIESRVAIGDLEAARRFAATRRGERERRQAGYRLIRHFVDIDRLDDALEMASRAPPGLHGEASWLEAIRELILALIETGRLDDARVLIDGKERILRSMSPVLESINDETLSFASREAAVLGELSALFADRSQEARDHFQRAEELAMRARKPIRKAQALVQLALSLTRSGRPGDARRIFGVIEETARSAPDAATRDETWENVAMAYVEAGLLDAAETAVGEILLPGKRSSVLAELALARLARQGPEAAMPLFESLEDEERSAVIADFANAWFAAGRPVRAFRLLRSCPIDQFLGIVAGWMKGWEHRDLRIDGEPMAMELLRCIVRVAAWRISDWRKIYQLLTADAGGPSTQADSSPSAP